MKFYRFLSYIRKSKISRKSKVFPFSRVTNSFIGDYSYVAYNCIINNCSIGKYCSIAQGVKIGLGKHPVNFISTSPLFYSPNNPLGKIITKELKFVEHEPVTIGNDVWIGANVIILDGINIGNGAVIGANSLVTKNIEPYSIAGGVPAKEIKKRFSGNMIYSIELSKWWDMPFLFFRDEKVVSIFSNVIDEHSILILLEKIKEFKKA